LCIDAPNTWFSRDARVSLLPGPFAGLTRGTYKRQITPASSGPNRQKSKDGDQL